MKERSPVLKHPARDVTINLREKLNVVVVSFKFTPQLSTINSQGSSALG